MSPLIPILTNLLCQIETLNDQVTAVHAGLTDSERRNLARPRAGFYERSEAIIHEAVRQPQLTAFVGVDPASMAEHQAVMEAARPVIMALTVLLRRVDDVSAQSSSALWLQCLDLYAAAQTRGRRNQSFALILRELESLFHNQNKRKEEGAESEDSSKESSAVEGATSK